MGDENPNGDPLPPEGPGPGPGPHPIPAPPQVDAGGDDDNGDDEDDDVDDDFDDAMELDPAQLALAAQAAQAALNAQNVNQNNRISSRAELQCYYGNRKTCKHLVTGEEMLGVQEWVGQVELFREGGDWPDQLTATRAQIALKSEAWTWMSNLRQQQDPNIANWLTLKPMILARFLRELTSAEVVQNERELKQGYFNTTDKPKETATQFMDRVMSTCSVNSAQPADFDLPAPAPPIEAEQRVVLARREFERTVRQRFLGGLDPYISQQMSTMFHNVALHQIPIDDMRKAATTVEVSQGRNVHHPNTNQPRAQVAALASAVPDLDDVPPVDPQQAKVDELSKKFDGMVDFLKTGSRGRGRGRGKRGKGGRGRGRGAPGAAPPPTASTAKCWKCGGSGHLARDCTTPDDLDVRGPRPRQEELRADAHPSHFDYSYMSGNY